MGNSNDHLEQVRSFILKNGFQEPIIIISCDLESGNAYITEGSHRLWVAHKEGIPSIPFIYLFAMFIQAIQFSNAGLNGGLFTMLCNSSLVVPKWFLYKARY